MNYLSLFTLSGSLLALFICGRLLVQKRINSVSKPLFWVVVFLSIRAYRDFQVFIPSTGFSVLESLIYFLSDTTLILPYLVYLWLCRSTGENKKFSWSALWPYSHQVFVALFGYWYPPLYGEVTVITSSILLFSGDLLLISLLFYYTGRGVEKKSRMGWQELVVVYGVLIGLSAQVLDHILRFLLNGLYWQEIFIGYMLVKSLLIFLTAYVLHQLYGGKTNHMVNRPKMNPVTAKPELIGAFLEKKMFLNHDVTVISAAKELGVPKMVLSKSIAELGVKNFVEFVNEHRLNHFLNLVEERVYLKLSIMGMAESSGFKSKATFNRVFKARMGQTPSDYINEQGLGNEPVALV